MQCGPGFVIYVEYKVRTYIQNGTGSVKIRKTRRKISVDHTDIFTVYIMVMYIVDCWFFSVPAAVT